MREWLLGCGDPQPEPVREAGLQHPRRPLGVFKFVVAIDSPTELCDCDDGSINDGASCTLAVAANRIGGL